MAIVKGRSIKIKNISRTEAWEKTIFGQPYSKANSRQFVTVRGRTQNVKSDAALGYARTFAMQCPTLDPLFEGDVAVEIVIYYASRRPDLDESLILDCLQGRIYRNDRQVREKHIFGRLDPQSPRATIRVAPVA